MRGGEVRAVTASFDDPLATGAPGKASEAVSSAAPEIEPEIKTSWWLARVVVMDVDNFVDIMFGLFYG